MHISFLRFKLEEEDFLKVSGVADQIISIQRDMRDKREAELEKKALADSEAARLHEIHRRQVCARCGCVSFPTPPRIDALSHPSPPPLQEDLLGMHHADEESKAAAAFLKKQQRSAKARAAKKEANDTARERLQMAGEEELSTRVDLAYRSRMEDKARKDARALEKANRRRDRADMVAAARDSRTCNDKWQAEYRAFAEFNRQVGAAENDAMEDEEQDSLIMNRIWQRIGRAKDYTRARQKKIAQRKAQLLDEAVGAAAATSRAEQEADDEAASQGTAPPETEAEAERRAVRDYLRLKGLEPPDSDSDAGGAAADAVDTLFEGQVDSGRNGWVSLADDDDYLYYFNTVTQETQWDKPSEW